MINELPEKLAPIEDEFRGSTYITEAYLSSSAVV
jgi:hypothetical protein